MSEDAVLVTRGDVTVEKRFVADEFPVPAITFDIRSEADEPVTVTVVDSIPESFPMDRIGFHPEYDNERWTAYKDHRVEYERTLPPGETVRTVYGVRLQEDTDPADFLTDPAIEWRDPSGTSTDEAIDELLGEDRDDLVREVLSGSRETFPGLDPDDDEAGAAEPRAVSDDAVSAVTRRESEAAASGSADGGDDLGRLETTDAAGGADSGVGEAGTDAEGGDDRFDDSSSGGSDVLDRPAAPAGESVAEALATELRDGSAAEEDLDILRSELDGGLPRSADVRIDRLQSQMEDLQAYSDALAEFIDEEGTGQEVLDALRDDVDSLATDVDELESAVETAADDRADLRETVDDAAEERATVRETAESTADRVDTVESDLGEATERLDALDDDVVDAADRIDSLVEDVDAASESLSGLDDEMGDVREDIATLDGDVSEVREDLETSIEEVRDRIEALEALETRLETMEASVEEIEAFRDRLSSVFGPASAASAEASADAAAAADSPDAGDEPGADEDGQPAGEGEAADDGDDASDPDGDGDDAAADVDGEEEDDDAPEEA